MNQIFKKQGLSRSFIRLAIVLLLVEFVKGAFLGSFIPFYGPTHLGLSISLVGMAVSIHFIFDIIFKLLAGFLMDKFRPRLIVHIGFLCSIIGFVLLYSAPFIWVFIIGAALSGVGGSPVWLVCLNSVKEKNRAAQMGILYTFWIVALGAGSVSNNFLMDIHAAVSFWSLVLCWGVAWSLFSVMKPANHMNLQVVSFKNQIVMAWNHSRKIKVLLPGMVLQTAAAGILVPILPHYTQILGLSRSQYSYLLIVGGAFTMLFLYPIGKFADRWGVKWFLIVGFTGLSVSLFTIACVSTYWHLLIAAASVGFFYSILLPAWNAMLFTFLPKNQENSGWGIFSSIEGCGIAIGPAVGGWFIHAFNESTAIKFSGVLLGVISIYYIYNLILAPKV